MKDSSNDICVPSAADALSTPQSADSLKWHVCCFMISPTSEPSIIFSNHTPGTLQNGLHVRAPPHLEAVQVKRCINIVTSL
jgi:hypothetical protein